MLNLQPEQKHEQPFQALNRFYGLVAKRTGLDRKVAEEVTFYLLSGIIMRLSATEAVQIIFQLPKPIQEELLDLRAGPNLDITADTLLSGLSSKFNMNATEAEMIADKIWDAVEDYNSVFPKSENMRSWLS